MQPKREELPKRLQLLLELLGVNRNEFGKALGYPRPQSVYDIVSGKNKPSYDFFARLMASEYSEKVDLYWLITGEEGKNAEGVTNMVEHQKEEILQLREELEEKNDYIESIREGDSLLVVKEEFKMLSKRLESFILKFARLEEEVKKEKLRTNKLYNLFKSDKDGKTLIEIKEGKLEGKKTS